MDEQRAWIKSRRRKRLRIMAVILCMCLLVTTRSDILATLSTFASEWKDSTVYVSGFGELPGAVREQTVPLGTGEEELTLPDTLEAFAETLEEEDKPGDAENPDGGADGTENPGDETDGTENPGNGTGESGNPEEGADDGSGDAGNAGDRTGGAGESGDGTGESGNPGDGTEGGIGGAGESGDETDESGNPEEGADYGSGDAGNAGEGTEGGSGNDGNTDEGNSGAGEPDGDSSDSEPETQNDNAPADDESGAEDADETAKAYDGVLTVQRGVFDMPVYMAEPEASAEPQTMERKEESVMIKGVTWQSEPAYDGNVEGTYVFTAILPEGYVLTEGVSLPQITVTVQGTDPVVLELLTRIAALPEAEEYLADEPDVEEEYEAWMDKLSAYTAEALDLWEMYEALTEEQRAQIPTEVLVKLAAWVELAGQLAESSMVMAAEDETVTITVTLLRNGSKWKGQNVTLRRDDVHYSTEETEDGVYSGNVEKGGNYFPCLDGKSIGQNYLNTDSGRDGSFTFYYVTVTYEADGATGTVPAQENAYCGRVTRADPYMYTVKPVLPLTSPGYVQTGWSETSGGSGEAVTEITVNQGTGVNGIRTTPIILYPVFEPATVTIHATNCTPEGIEQNESGVYETTVGESGDYSVTFKPASLYNVPADVTVEIGGTTLISGDYTYTSGKLTIPRSKITGNITITAEAEAKPATITVRLNLDGSAWSGQTVTLKKDSQEYPVAELENEGGAYHAAVERGGKYYIWVNGVVQEAYFDTDSGSSSYSGRLYYVTVTYMSDGAGGKVPEQKVYYCGSSSSGARNYKVDETLPLTKPGYVQTGWSETSGGEAVKTIQLKAGVSGEARTTPINLYPVFTPAAVTINATNCTHDGQTVVGDSGDYMVTFTPKDGYHVPKTVTVQIGGKALGSGEYTYTNGKLTIPRSKITGNITITAEASSEHSLTYTADTAQGTITESCQNGCGHSATAGFETFLAEPYTYTGNAIEPFGVKYASSASAWLGTSKPTIGYTNNTNAGTATATLLAGTKQVSKTFTISSKSLTDASVKVTLDADLYQYTGKAIEPVVTVRDSAIGTGGRTLVKGADYSVSYQNNTAVGSNAQAILTGMGNYTGTCTVNFIIKASDIPAPEPKKVTVTDTTATVSDPAAGEEYVLVASGGTPDWNKAQTDTTFTGLTPNTSYDLYVRKQATDDSFASESAKTQIRTSVTIKEPEIGGEGAGEDGNDVSGGKPSADGGSVTYTGTCEEGYTPVIIVDGKEIIPEITWDEDGKKGTWSYTVDVEDGKSEVGIRVEFRERTYTGLEIEPGSLHIYADNTANQSADKLLDYLKVHCTVKATYDNGTSDDMTNGADYKADREFNVKGAVYEYTLEVNAEVGKAILTVSPVTAVVKTPEALAQTPKSEGYTKAEVDAWLPKEVTVTYTGADGYEQRSESRPVTWNTDALGTGFGTAAGSKTISGTAALPEWATGENTVNIEIGFMDRNALTDDQMNLSISGWTYGAQTAPAPEGSVTVTDVEQTYSYRYSADNGTSWVTADGLPKSWSGNIIPGDYLVEMTYTGRNYTGTKTAAFTVGQKPVTAEKGTLAVENRNYDGTTKATLKAGGKPALVGVIENDDVALGGTLKAVFTDKGPNKNIPVTVTGFALTGSEAGYYKLVNTTLTLKATISNKDGSLSSGGSSGNNSGSDNGDSGDSGDNGNGGDSADNSNSGNGGNNGTSDSTGSGGNAGTGGNNGGTDGNNSGTGGNNGGTDGNSSETGSNKGTGNGNAGGTGKGTVGSGTGKGSTENGNTGTDRDTGENGTTGNDSIGNGGDKNGAGNGNRDAGARQEGNGQQTKSVTVQTVQAAADDGRIVIFGETEAPVMIGTLTEDAPGATRLLIGRGTVTVTVICEDDQYTVGMNDATAVANAVLTPEQIQRVDEGESLEIRVDIRDISQSIPPQDRETVENGYEAYGKYLSELKRGGYVDISVYLKTGDGGWNAVEETSEPLEIVIGIPEGLRGVGREYYIIRAHEGRYTLLNDMDAVPETITIVTDLFSSYAIAYREAGGEDTGNGGMAYGLSHISPKFLGIVSLIWLTVAVAGIIIVIIVLRRKKDGEKATTV